MNLKKQLVFFKNLKKAVKSGLPLDNFFNRLAGSAVWPSTRNLHKQISKDIEKGSTITDALAKNTGIIDELYISLVNAGEKSGKLDEIIDNIINIIENRIFLRKKIFSELRQPLFNIAGALVVLGILLFAFIPALAGFFTSFSSCPPCIVRVTQGFQQAFLTQSMIFAVVFVITALAGVDFYMSGIKNIPEYVSFRVIKLPIIGDLARWAELYVYFLVLKSCHAGGLSFIEATELANTTVKNHYLKQFTDDIHEKSKDGEPISAILQGYGEPSLFEPEISQLLEAGEATGRTEESYGDVIYLLRENMESKIELICNITPVLGFILAASPVVLIVLIILAVISKAAGIIMNAPGGLGL